MKDKIVIARTGKIELDFGVEVISRQSPSLFLLFKSTKNLDRIQQFSSTLMIKILPL